MTHIQMTPEMAMQECSQCFHRSILCRRYLIECEGNQETTSWLCPLCETTRGVIKADLTPPPPTKGAQPPSKRYRRSIRRHERELAEKVGGRVQKASGALSGYKGDVRKKGLLRGESKETTKNSFVLKREILDKIRGECEGSEQPFLYIRFTNPTTYRTEDEWVCIPFEDWEHAKRATEDS